MVDLSFMFCASAFIVDGNSYKNDRRAGCNIACSHFNDDISSWDTSVVANMAVRGLPAITFLACPRCAAKELLISAAKESLAVPPSPRSWESSSRLAVSPRCLPP